MSNHKFLWNPAINGHACAHCGATMATATPAQYAARQGAHDTLTRLADNHDASAWQSVTAAGQTVFIFTRNTAQGYAEIRQIINAQGETIARAYRINGKAVEVIPVTFKAFHRGYTPEMQAAIAAYAIQVWACNIAETNPECPNAKNGN